MAPEVWKRLSHHRSEIVVGLFVVLGLTLTLLPIVAWAAVPEAKEAVALAPEVPAAVGMWKTLFTISGAMLTVVLTAWATAYVQGKIGPAGCGAMAEKPEVAGTVFIMIAIPETLVVLGFVISAMIILMVK